MKRRKARKQSRQAGRYAEEAALLARAEGTGVTFLRLADGRLVPTHPMGDTYAAQVLDGTIPLKTAQENEQRAQRQLSAIRHRRQDDGDY